VHVCWYEIRNAYKAQPSNARTCQYSAAGPETVLSNSALFVLTKY